MITLLVPLIAALAGEPSPAPAAPAAPTPLREIGRVQSLSVCTTIVVHANSAIGDALANDQTLAIIVNHLRTSDLDGANPMERHRRINDLYDLSARIRSASTEGDGEIKRLRATAAAASDKTRKTELTAFADALGGVLLRQKRVAMDLAKSMTILEGRRSAQGASDILDSTRSASQTIAANRLNETARYAGRVFAGADAEENQILRDVADDFDARIPKIMEDEGTAADHSIGATTGC